MGLVCSWLSLCSSRKGSRAEGGLIPLALVVVSLQSALEIHGLLKMPSLPCWRVYTNTKASHLHLCTNICSPQSYTGPHVYTQLYNHTLHICILCIGTQLVHTCIQTYTLCKAVSVYVLTYKHTYIYTHSLYILFNCMSVYTHTMHIHTHACVYIYIYIYIYICMTLCV